MAIAPTGDCKTELNKYGLIFKSFPGGGVIFFSGNEQKEIIPIPVLTYRT